MKKLIVAAALVSSVAFAGAKAEDKFKTLDKDGDGQVTSEEAAGDAELAAKFSTLDKNGDGKLSLDEYKAAAADAHGKKEVKKDKPAK